MNIDFIVVESGGSKSTWCLGSKNDGLIVRFQVEGLHPAELSEQKQAEVSRQLLPYTIAKDTRTYFYGAGCESPILSAKLRDFLGKLGIRKIDFYSDLNAACIATLHQQSGYAGIIGTGAILAEYDGNNVVRFTSGLGHILGDEGSGFDIGKRILNAYFRNQLPEIIATEIEEYFGGRHQIIPKSYAANSRKLIAGLTRVIYPHRMEPRIAQLLHQSFEAFYETAIADHQDLSSLSLVGGVAIHFQEEIKATLKKHDIHVDKILPEAVDELFDYHFHRETR
jgi:glucosamine kinase